MIFFLALCLLVSASSAMTQKEIDMYHEAETFINKACDRPTLCEIQQNIANSKWYKEMTVEMAQRK